MARFVMYSLLLAVLSVTCWAQFKVTGIVPPKNYSPAKPGTTFNGIQYNTTAAQ